MIFYHLDLIIYSSIHTISFSEEHKQSTIIISSDIFVLCNVEYI